MFIVKLAILVLWISRKEGECLNLTQHGNDVEKLKESLQLLTTSVSQMQADYARKEATFRAEIDQLKNETTFLKSQLSTKGHSEVAFTARLSRTVSLGTGQTVIFDIPLLNLGNAYHETYGHFTAPVDGIYQFSVIVINNGNDITLSIVRNGNDILVDLFSKGDYVPASGAIVVDLHATDVLFVRAKFSGSLQGAHYSVFSGFLIQSL